jgi:F420-dependent oxidoreductase-like protein
VGDKQLKLGLRLEMYRAAELHVPVELVRHAEALGYHSVWSAEAYGADALSPLAYLAACTDRIKLGTAAAQLAARPPTTLAMHALTIDALAGGGRVIVGVGVSGPQIVEGWYGQPWGRPHARLRDYLTIVRKVLARQHPVTHEGDEIALPYRGAGATGQGKPLKSILRPVGEIELWLASGGPINTGLCAELCDGWLPMGLPSEGVDAYREVLDSGFARRAERRNRERFEVFTGLSVEITDDVASALDRIRPLTAMYIGGMGSATHNYHREAMARRGFPEAAERIQSLWLSGRQGEAIAAVPDDYLEQTALVGPPGRIRRRWRDGAVPPGVTGVIVSTEQPAAVALLAELAGARDRGSVTT